MINQVFLKYAKNKITGEPVKVFVTDFIITIIPKGGIINLDAIKCFIWDLVSLGNIKIKVKIFLMDITLMHQVSH